MLKSMTGYGCATASQKGFTFSAEIRSLNHRFADFSIRLPRELYALEERVRSFLQEKIKRGRVEVYLNLEEVPAALRQVSLNQELAEDYFTALGGLTQKLGLEEKVKLKHLLVVPELFAPAKIALAADEVWPICATALEEALSSLLKERCREGENLCRDLVKRLDHLKELVDEAAIRAEEAKDEYRERLSERFNDLLAGQFEETRLIMECAILVERMGVDEELVRLRSHCAAFASHLKASEPAGRKLDFIAQEMFREVNTIGSKAGDFKLAHLVVEMKAELEKIREQIQNLE